MKNKIKKISKLLCVALLIVVLQTMGYTYAKYVSSEKATGQAEIAQWAFQIKKDGETTKNIDLGSTVNRDTLVNGKIAPGTSGVISIVLDASGSEVDLDYTVKFNNEQNKPDNLYFTCAGNQYSNLSDIDTIQGTMEYDAVQKTREIVVLWNWGYETGATKDVKAANDIIDTKNASEITKYTFDVVVTATQSK